MNSNLLFLLAFGILAANANVCIFPANCPVGTTCTNGKCINDTTGTWPARRFQQECPPECQMPACQCYRGFIRQQAKNVCIFPADCPTGTTCTNGKCVDDATGTWPAPRSFQHLKNVCIFPADCPTGTTCTNGKCVDDATGTWPAPRSFQHLKNVCIFPADCPTGTTCTNGKCVDDATGTWPAPSRHFFTFEFRCTDSVECPDNRTCINGSCVVMG